MKLNNKFNPQNKPMFVLCGGLGTRLKESLGDVPKSLAPINGKPFLEYLLKHWTKNRINHYVFLLGHKAKQIHEYLQQANIEIFPDCKFEYIVEEESLGTGGAIANALEVLKFNGEFFVINSDTWLSAGLESFLEAKSPAIGVVFQNDTKRYGILELSDDNKISSFKEKSEASNSGFINSGLYLFNSNLFLDWDKKPCSIEETYLTQFAKQGKLTGVYLETSFIDIGIPKDYNYFKNNFMKITNE